MDGYDHHFGYITKLAPQKTKKTLRQQMHQTTQNHFHSKSTQNHLNGINPHNLPYRNVCHNDNFLCGLFTCSVAEIIYDFTRSTHFLSVFFFSEWPAQRASAWLHHGGFFTPDLLLLLLLLSKVGTWWNSVCCKLSMVVAVGNQRHVISGLTRPHHFWFTIPHLENVQMLGKTLLVVGLQPISRIQNVHGIKQCRLRNQLFMSIRSWLKSNKLLNA